MIQQKWMKIVMILIWVNFTRKYCRQRISCCLAIHRSLCRLTVDDLNFILNNNQKLESLPDPVESNVVYRLSLTIQTQGESYCWQDIFNIICCLDLWKLDGYIWKNDKTIPYTRQKPEFTKTYYSCINSDKKKDSRCVKHVYVSKKNELDVIVYYIGKQSCSYQVKNPSKKL